MHDVGQCRSSSETQSKETAIVNGICDACWQDMIVDIEAALETLGRNGVRVHRHDVLEAKVFGFFRTKLKRFSNLTFVHTIEKMAIVDQEAG